jgi:cobalt-zinc-cadmium efflux system outer membrane protein
MDVSPAQALRGEARLGGALVRRNRHGRVAPVLCLIAASVVWSVSSSVAHAGAPALSASASDPRGSEVPVSSESSRVQGDAMPALDLSGPLSLGDALCYAESRSAALKAAEARWEAADAGIATVGSLPDPVVSYGYFLEEVETRVGPQTQRFGVRQTLPLFGKIGLAKAAAGAAAAAQHERYRAARLALAAEVTAAYAEYAYLARATEIVGARLELVRALGAAARARYSAGDAPYADVARAEIELARMENELETMSARRAPASARLAAAMSLDTDAVLPWPEEMPAFDISPSGDEARRLLEERNPEFRAVGFEVDRAAEAARLARRRYFPDLTVGFDYILTDEAAMPVEDSGKDPIVAVASISVPLWFGKHSGAARAARASSTAALMARRQLQQDLAARLETLLYEVDDARRKVALYGDRLIPLAAQSYASVEAAYRAGASDFDSLIGAHQTALEFELTLARARADAAIRAAELEKLLGDDGFAGPWRAWEAGPDTEN